MRPENKQSGGAMWPFQEMSLPAANAWANAASLALLVCFVGAAIATFVLVRANNVKEHYLRAELQQAQLALVAKPHPVRALPAPARPNNEPQSVAPQPAQAPVERPPAPRVQPANINGSRALTDEQIQALVQKMSAFKKHHVTVGA